MPGIDLVMVLQPPAAEHPVHEFVREVAFPGAVGLDPFREHGCLDPPHRFHFGNAGVGHPVHMPVQQGLLFRGRQVPIVRDPLVVVVGNQVEDILFEVGARTDDGVHLVLADHLREGDAQFRRRHRTRHGHQHLASSLQVCLVALGCVHQGRRVEMAVIMGDKPGHRTLGPGQTGVDVLGSSPVSSCFHEGKIEKRSAGGHKKPPARVPDCVRPLQTNGSRHLGENSDVSQIWRLGFKHWRPPLAPAFVEARADPRLSPCLATHLKQFTRS